jgi:oxalate decarboxylase
MKRKNTKKHEPVSGKLGGSILGPRNKALETQNPDLFVPPSTDEGLIPNLKWSFADSHMRIEEGGWTREVTIRELPASPTIAGVNMRLKAGGVRELHWHHQAEWSFMLKGAARITAVDQNGCTFQDDLSEGDIWYFPAGIPHSIQGLEDDGCEFLLVFDDGSFSENDTFSLTDWLAHTPKEVIAKNFQVAASALAHIPAKELYMFQTRVPGPLGKDRLRGNGPVPLPFSYRMMAQKPLRTKSGTVRITDASLFPVSKTIAAALVEIEPGGLRELHWHPNADEWQYYITGQARMTVFSSGGNARTFNYQAGDVGVVPVRMGHYIENRGTTTLRFLEIFKSDYFADISLAQWLAFTPHELVRAHVKINESVLEKIPQHKQPVVP